MNTKWILIFSALILGSAGILLTFIPNIILSHLDIKQMDNTMFLMQILGGLYFGFAMLNWMIKGSLIGGIYNRPVAVANFAHFLIAGLALIKGVISNPNASFTIWIAGILYFLFGVLFGLILFRHPIKENNEA